VDVAIVERRPSQALDGPRSRGLQARTIEVLDQRGIADRFLAAGTAAQVAGFSGIRLNISDFPSRHPYGLALLQKRFEQILAGWIDELGVPIHRRREVTGFAQDDTGVHVRLSDGAALRAQYLVGCDGGRSLIRRTAGIEFPGWDPTRSNLIAEVEMTEEPPPGVRHNAAGVHGLHTMEDGRTVRVVLSEQQLGPSSEPTLRDLSEALIIVYGTDFGVHNPTWISRFTDMTRQAAAYRDRRVLLAGDAAHVHYPAGGQGLSLGVQDAVNLGWKLAQVAAGTSPDSLLDTYHAERHPVAARALRHTMAQGTLQRRDDRMQALVDVVSGLASMDEPRKLLAGLVSGLDIHYDLGEGHPLLGRRMPDLNLITADGQRRVFELLHDARPLLLNFGQPGEFDITPWAGRVQRIDASYAGEWELPVLGPVDAPTAVLIRPDGYVAWVGDGSDLGLVDALTTWFGPPTAA
jgi:2-polyprenyl-6-methoxyphenol hydroxylase-like FAD-dependent oxidoreductase